MAANKENINVTKGSGDNVMYLRMSVNERIQHFLLLSSFITLILTGFGLKFPEAFWVKWIVWVIGENAFEARGVVHRIASIVMIAASIYHLYYILFVPRGKQLIRDFLPTKQDLFDFRDSMLYLIGMNEKKPRYGRFGYMEKMEYWAVVWGTVIMGATGFILWFENYFLKYVGTTGMDISTTIHYYEAILASLAILVWHFYFIFLNPDVAPMNKAWSKGYLTRHQMEHEHPLELEQIDAELKAKEIPETITKETDGIAEDKSAANTTVHAEKNETVQSENEEQITEENKVTVTEKNKEVKTKQNNFGKPDTNTNRKKENKK
ncbi:MAG: cytochrome b/b6 domain-containing protein [Ignavibacteria bacterium]|nr:cytochrome b/b6 domain-containing protein [Ignavibacteria bacterium]